MNRMALWLALALFCLAGAGPVWAQTGPDRVWTTTEPQVQYPDRLGSWQTRLETYVAPSEPQVQYPDRTGSRLTNVAPSEPQPSTAAAMAGPMRIADSPLGLLVGDYVGFGVMFVNPVTLALEETVPVTGKPLGVAWMNGLVYVGDEKTGAIQVYEKVRYRDPVTRKKIYGWVQASASLTASAIGGPADIAADEGAGLLFVASKTDKTVYVLDETGAVIRTIGGPGSTNPVGRPQGLALDRAGQRLFVSDDGGQKCSWMGCAPASAVHVYDYNGNFLGAIPGNSGQANFGFSRAQGVTVDSNGRVYLVDSWRCQVLVFDEIGANSWSGIGTFGWRGSGPKELLLPMDVFVDEASSTVYVTNNMKGRVEVFDLADMVQ